MTTSRSNRKATSCPKPSPTARAPSASNGSAKASTPAIRRKAILLVRGICRHRRTIPRKSRTMKQPLVFACAMLLSACVFAADDYKPGPDSTTQPDVPHGEILKFRFENSKIFPGTVRDCTVYIPAQYTPDKPACVYVQQDGVGFKTPTVFDNLINRKEMPITIAVFVSPGIVKTSDAKIALDRFNRSYEYDGLGDNYVRFLLEELLPEVEKKTTTEGRAIKLS